MRIKILALILIAVLAIGCVQVSTPSNATSNSAKIVNAMKYLGKKIFYIDSYDPRYNWSQGEQRGAIGALNGTGAELKIVYMNTNQVTEETAIEQEAADIKTQIDNYNPDVIISADDAAFKYVIMPYYRNSDIPVVFCGINWDASIYGAPYNNTAGMLEVSLVPQLLTYMKLYAKGPRIGYISGDVLTNRKEAENYRTKFGITMTEAYVTNFDSWKTAFLKLENMTDMIFFYSNAGIENWNNQEAETFMEQNIKVPVSSALDFMLPYSVLVLAKVPEEQGEFAAQSALRIIDGTKPSDIPIAENKRGDLLINVDLANRLGIVLTPELIKNAKTIYTR